MPYDPQVHHRHSIRLKGYDYSREGAYFVTLVCQHRYCFFGEFLDGEIRLNKIGALVEREWRRIERNFSHIRIDEFVIMPNHLHGIIWIIPRRGEASTLGHQRDGEQEKKLIYGNLRNRLEVEASPQSPRGTHPNSLGAILQNFKSISTRKVNQAAGCSGSKIWQRDYYERIIRDEPELLRIRRYIHDNPLHWEQDQVRPSSL